MLGNVKTNPARRNAGSTAQPCSSVAAECCCVCVAAAVAVAVGGMGRSCVCSSHQMCTNACCLPSVMRTASLRAITGLAVPGCRLRPVLATRAFSPLARPPPNYPGHVPLTPSERVVLAGASAVMSLINPRRGGSCDVKGSGVF